MEQDFKTVLTQKVEEVKELKKLEMTTEVAHKKSTLASEIIKLIKENPEEVEKINLEELSENLKGFLYFLIIPTLKLKLIRE